MIYIYHEKFMENYILRTIVQNIYNLGTFIWS